MPCLVSFRKSYLKQSQQHSGKRIAQESMLYLTGKTTLIPSREEKEKIEGVSSALQIHINSGKTPIPKQWAKYMSNPVNKTSMVRFLCETWVKMGKSELKPGERFFIGEGFC